MRLALKIGILRTGKTQRQISLEARIPEGRLSELVRRHALPTASERDALNTVLGSDYFDEFDQDEDDDVACRPVSGLRSRR